jgi:Domain of unknown function (DUF5069)
MPDDKKIFALDLTKRPPRSPRLRLGGYALLPRMLDKGPCLEREDGQPSGR